MSCDPEDEEFMRVPGLFRCWELPQILEPGQSFRLENAGTTSDGTALVAVYLIRAGKVESALPVGMAS